MANLSRKGDHYVARFRYEGKEYKRSLRTADLKEAQAGLKRLEALLHDVQMGRMKIPEGADAGQFLVTGGKVRSCKQSLPVLVYPTTADLIKQYLAHKSEFVAPSYHRSQQTHFKHFQAFLGKTKDQPCNQITQVHVENYLLERKKICESETIVREQCTLTLFYKWVAKRQGIPSFPSPMVGLERYKSLKQLPPFRTLAEVTEIVERGGLAHTEKKKLWKCLYLTPAEIAGLLATIRKRSKSTLSLLLHAIPAYTGMRRGEVLRLRWQEVNLQSGTITAISRKQSRSTQETTRVIEMHPELQLILKEWSQRTKRGQYVLSLPRSVDPLTIDEANRLFWRPMRRTEWCLSGRKSWFKLAFHTYRHSFASNLAAAGVDYRIIDEFMGHQTEHMRRRYQHLFPSNKKSAITSFSFQSS